MDTGNAAVLPGRVAGLRGTHRVGTSDLLGTFGGIPVYRGRKRLRQVHASQEPAGAAAAAEGRSSRRSDTAGAASAICPSRPQAQRDFPATVSEVVLSGFLSARGPAVLLLRRREVAGADEHGKAGDTGVEGPLLPGAVRRPAAARARSRGLCAPPGELLILDEPVTGLDPAAAQDLYRTLALSQQKGGHRHRHGDPRPAERPALRRHHPACRAGHRGSTARRRNI